MCVICDIRDCLQSLAMTLEDCPPDQRDGPHAAAVTNAMTALDLILRITGEESPMQQVMEVHVIPKKEDRH